VPITLAILLGLFLVQRHGTGFIGALFGPVMPGWFLLLAVLGLGGILRAPDVLAAVSPFHALALQLRFSLQVCALCPGLVGAAPG
jgi:KUP system potassium uptake protein